jgi:hypothetical protein
MQMEMGDDRAEILSSDLSIHVLVIQPSDEIENAVA